jgi:hypothetical protein
MAPAFDLIHSPTWLQRLPSFNLSSGETLASESIHVLQAWKHSVLEKLCPAKTAQWQEQGSNKRLL